MSTAALVEGDFVTFFDDAGRAPTVARVAEVTDTAVFVRVADGALLRMKAGHLRVLTGGPVQPDEVGQIELELHDRRAPKWRRHA